MENTSDGNSVEQAPQQQVAAVGLPEVLTLFRLAFEYYKEHVSTIVSIMIVPFVLQAASIFLGNSGIAAFFSLAAVVASIFGTIVLLGLIVGGWNKDDGVGLLYQKSFKWIGPLILVNAYVVLATIGGLFLLVIPGIYASVCLIFSMYILFAENKRGMSAVVASWYYVKGYWGGVLWRIVALWLLSALIGLLFAGIGIGPSISALIENMKDPSVVVQAPKMSVVVGLLSALVQNLAIMPITLIYTSFILKSLRALKPTMPEDEGQKIQQTVKRFMIVGLVGLVLVIVLSGFFIVSQLGHMYGGQTSSLIDSLQGILGR